MSARVSPAIRQGQTVVVTYTDPTAGDDANAIQDTAGNDAASFTTGVSGVPAITNNSTLATTVPANWSLKPTGLASGDKFRLLFLSSTTRTATATAIADYNTFVQDPRRGRPHRHPGLQRGLPGGRLHRRHVDARDNTNTTGTRASPSTGSTAPRPPTTTRTSTTGPGTTRPTTRTSPAPTAPIPPWRPASPFTGCEHNGTEAFLGTASRALGNSSARVGRPNSSNTNNGPLSSGNVATSTDTLPMYGLSALFQVGANTAPGAPTGLTATASGTDTIDLSWTAPASDGGSAITGYKIEVSPNGTSSWTDLVADTASTATTYEHTGLAAGTTRHYRVSAINSIGTSTASDVANTNTVADTTPPTLTSAEVNPERRGISFWGSPRA